MSLEPQVGDPVIDGRYVVFTPCQAAQVRDWTEPSIATWHGGKWHYGIPIWGWIGPLPVVHGDELLDKLRAQKGGSAEKSWDEVFSDLRKTEHGSYVAPQTGTAEYDL